MPKGPIRLTTWRKSQGLTVAELAERAGLTSAVITGLEGGVRGYDQEVLEALAPALNCTPSQLISEEPPPALFAPAAPWTHPDRPVGHFLREWRLHRNFTLQELARLAGMTHANLSRLERGLIPYSQRSLERLATALRTDPGSIILIPPDLAGIFHVLLGMSPARRAQLSDIAQIISRDDDPTVPLVSRAPPRPNVAPGGRDTKPAGQTPEPKKLSAESERRLEQLRGIRGPRSVF